MQSVVDTEILVIVLRRACSGNKNACKLCVCWKYSFFFFFFDEV